MTPTRHPARSAGAALTLGLVLLATAACSGSSGTASPGGAPAASAPSTATTSPAAPTPPASTTSSGPAASAPAPAAISIKDFMFTVPASVPAGSAVQVTNNDSEAHTVTSKDGGFDVKVPPHGGTAVLTAPKTAGSYHLTCDFHADMSGTLVVR